MREPFESEPEAFRFVILTGVAFAVIAAAALLGGPWVGVPVWAVLTGIVALDYLRRRPQPAAPAAQPHIGPAGERRILVVEQAAPAAERLVQEIGRVTGDGRPRVLLVAPPHASALHHWASDVDRETEQAHLRLQETVYGLRTAGIDADARIGDEDPLAAIDDALRTFGADEIIISSDVDGERVAARARERYDLPITVVKA